MTPPDTHKQTTVTPSNKIRETSPRPKYSNSPPITVSIPEDNSVSEVESICVDILLKVDTLLSSGTPNRTMGESNDLSTMTQVRNLLL